MSDEPLRVLVVDDDHEIRELLKVRLRKEGFDARAFEGGEQALAGIADWKPDAAVIDIMMPGMHGYRLCGLLKEDASLDGIRVVMLSAKSFRPDIEKAKAVGADAYLVKPIKFQELIAALRSDVAPA